MAKITWLGEEDGITPGPSFMYAYDGIKFDKGIPVDITDKSIIERCKGSKYFEVTGLPGRPPKASDAPTSTADSADVEAAKVAEAQKVQAADAKTDVPSASSSPAG